MNQRLKTLPILVLSIGLQLLPLCRQLFVAPAALGSPLAIIFRWAAGAVALLGANHAVSGATSTAINSSNTANATVGKKFNYTITTTGYAAFSWSASNLPTNIVLVNNHLTNSTANVSTPVGSYAVTLIAYEGTAQDGGQTGPFLLTLNVGNAPSITTQPTNQSVIQGSDATFAVTTSGTGPFAYQWTFGGNNILGANGQTLTIPNVQTTDAGTYRVNVSTPFGTTNSPSNRGILTVLVPPTIDLDPFDVTAAPGDSVTLSVTASGTGPLKYQWLFNDNPVSKGTNLLLTLKNVASSNAGSYACVVTNTAGSVTSAPAVVTILGAPTISSQPQSFTATEGDPTALSVTAGPQPLTYQWYFNNVPLPFETDSSIFLNPLGTNQAGPYYVIISNTYGSVTSDVATVTVLSPPRVVSPPSNVVAVVGGNATFQVTASGTGPLGYQWLLNGSNVSGAAAMVLNLTNLSPGQAGNYSVIITNMVGSVTSAPATLTISGSTAPSISLGPQSLTVWSGSNASFSVNANGTDPLLYQWRFKGSDISGKTQSTLSLTTVNSNNAGAYQVVITNSAGSVTSAPAVLTVAERSTLKVVGQSASAVQVGFTIQPGVSYELLCFNTLVDTNQITLTNWPPQASSSNAVFADPLTNGLGRFYRLRMNIP